MLRSAASLDATDSGDLTDAVAHISGKVVLALGLASRAAENPPWIFDPATRSFSSAASLRHIERLRSTLDLLPDGKLQLIDGDRERTMEMFDPDGEYFTAYAHLVDSSTPLSISIVMRAQSRAALLHRTDEQAPDAVKALEGPLGPCSTEAAIP